MRVGGGGGGVLPCSAPERSAGAGPPATPTSPAPTHPAPSFNRPTRDGSDVYAVNAMTFHPTYGTFVTAGSDGAYNFWDKDSKQRLKAMQKGAAPIPCGAFNRRAAQRSRRAAQRGATQRRTRAAQEQPKPGGPRADTRSLPTPPPRPLPCRQGRVNLLVRCELRLVARPRRLQPGHGTQSHPAARHPGGRGQEPQQARHRAALSASPAAVACCAGCLSGMSQCLQ